MRLLCQHLQTVQQQYRSRDITLAASNKTLALSECHIRFLKTHPVHISPIQSQNTMGCHNIHAQFHDPFYYLFLHFQSNVTLTHSWATQRHFKDLAVPNAPTAAKKREN